MRKVVLSLLAVAVLSFSGQAQAFVYSWEVTPGNDNFFNLSLDFLGGLTRSETLALYDLDGNGVNSSTFYNVLAPSDILKTVTLTFDSGVYRLWTNVGGVLTNPFSLGSTPNWGFAFLNGSPVLDYSLTTLSASHTYVIENKDSFLIQNADPTAVPIPGAIWLLGAGLMGLMGVRRFAG